MDEYAAPHIAERTQTVVERVGIDEFSVRCGRRYATGLHDLVRRRGIAVMDGRTTADARQALKQLAAPERVQVVSMDMAQAYRSAVQEVLPQAVIVVDKFHVVARLHEALRQVLARLRRSQSRTDPRWRDGRLVLQGRERAARSAGSARAG